MDRADRVATQVARADALSALQNLGEPLSKATARVVPLPCDGVPGRLGLALQANQTRVKRCCKDPRGIDRFVSELYPIPPPQDTRAVTQEGGTFSRLDGRVPVVYRR